MAASQSLRPETMRAEASYAELGLTIKELDQQYDAQEHAALLGFAERLKVVDARAESQRADMVSLLQQLQHESQCELLQQLLRESVEEVLREKRDMELNLLRRAHQDQQNARRSQHDAQKQTVNQKLFEAINALVAAKVSKPLLCVHR